MKKYLIMTLVVAQGTTSMAQLNKENLNLSFYRDNAVNLTSYSYTSSPTMAVQVAYDSIVKLMDLWEYKNMRIYPIVGNEVYSEESKVKNNYVSLKEALEKQTIEVRELSTGGTVNTLKLSNLGKDTIYIMAGEVVLGGKQDRAIGQELILPPGAKDVQVKVFCVEHHRWSQGSDGTKFNGYYGIAGNQVRKKVVVDKNQSQVWAKVDEAHGKAGVSSSTSSFKDIKKSEDYMKTMGDYKEYYLPKLKAVENLLGFVIVSGDKIMGLEAFATEHLMKQQLDKLLESYATEAMQEGAKVTVTTEQVDAYMKQVLDETKQEQIIEKGGSELKLNNKKLHISVLEN